MKPSIALANQRVEVGRVLAQHGVSEAFVFGSVTTGEDVEGSDLDIAVTFVRPPRGFAYYGALAELQYELEQLTGVPVDVIDIRTIDDEFLGGAIRLL